VSASGRSYDVVIVGGGSAGCVLANRLSADPATRVLVLEAGRPDAWWDVYVHMPAALSFPIGNPRYDWGYESEPEPFMHDRRIYHARGKLLGGSSSINGMIFQRGNPLDFERWAARPGLDRVAKMRMRPLECGDRGVEIIDVQHDAIPAARLLLRTVRHRAATRRVWTAEKHVQIATCRDEHGPCALYQTKSKLVGVEPQRAFQVGDLVADDRRVLVGHECVAHVRSSVANR